MIIVDEVYYVPAEDVEVAGDIVGKVDERTEVVSANGQGSRF